jgi:glycine cleavage system transcriptional repressor
MKEWIIIMAAANRAGILAAVTRAITELRGDLREASQTVVRGHFTMIFSAEFPGSLEQSIIRDHLQDACRPFGIELVLREQDASAAAPAQYAPGTTHFRLRLGGRNEPGVLRRLSQIMARHSVDITGMHAERSEDGQSFEMIQKLALPAGVDPLLLQQEVEAAGQDFGVTADLRAAD